MHRVGYVLLGVLMLTGLWASPVLASPPCNVVEHRLDEIQSHDQLTRFVQCAVAHAKDVGWDQASADFQTHRAWLDGSMYLFAGDSAGTVDFIAGAGPESAPGTDLSNLQDEQGYYIVQNMIRIVEHYGSGYVYYQFGNRNTGQVEPKVAYLTATDFEVNGEKMWIGAGYYPLVGPGACSPERVRASLVYTASDVESFVHCAAQYLQQEGLSALHTFDHDPRWRSGPTYLFMLDWNDITITGGGTGQIGIDMTDVADANDMIIMDEIRRVLDNFGEGYVYYTFLNPATMQDEAKTSFVTRISVAGHPYVLGTGLYVSSPACRTVPPAYAVDTAAELEQYVTCAAELVRQRGTEAYDLLLHHPHWIDGETYVFIVDPACRSVLYPLDYRSDEEGCDVTDEDGVKLNELIVKAAASPERQGWVNYRWLNPDSNVVETKSSFVVGVEVGDELLAVGAGIYLSE